MIKDNIILKTGRNSKRYFYQRRDVNGKEAQGEMFSIIYQ